MLHEALIGILVLLLVFAHGVAVVVELGLHVFPLEGVSRVDLIVVAGIFDALLENVGLVQSDYSFFEFLEVANPLEYIMHVILETLLLCVLGIKLFSTVCILVLKASLAHGEVIDYKAEVSVDLPEVDHLSLHPGHVLVQVLDLLLPRAYVPLQLLDFVVEHELELLQLLGLLLQLHNAVLFVVDRGLSLVEFCLLGLDL